MARTSTPKPPASKPPMTPDTGKRGVQPVGQAKPYPPPPMSLIVPVKKGS